MSREKDLEAIRAWLHFTRNSGTHAMARMHVQTLLDIIDEQAEALGVQHEEIRQLWQERLQERLDVLRRKAVGG